MYSHRILHVGFSGLGQKQSWRAIASVHTHLCPDACRASSALAHPLSIPRTLKGPHPPSCENIELKSNLLLHSTSATFNYNLHNILKSNTMQAPICRDCFTGTLRGDVTPSGSEQTIHGLPTYVSVPDPGVKPLGTVVIVTDAFGWTLLNTRALADAYARRIPCTVYVPDFMAGETTSHPPYRPTPPK